MLCGLIMYIAIFKSEVGSKLRPRSQLQPPAFEYRYGFSFILYVIGTIFTQLTGLFCIFLYIYRTQYKWKRKQYENLIRGECVMSLNNFNYIDSAVIYPCRRHPHAYINSNSAILFANQKRFCFPKETPSAPQFHSNSMKDISGFYNMSPPPAISYHFSEILNRNSPKNFHIPRDATTNTVSTTAELACDEYLSEPFDDYSSSIQHEFVTFDLDEPLPLRATSIGSLSSKKFYDGTDSLRRTTPV